MKKYIIYITLLCFIFTACDNIPEDERSTVVENVNAVRPVLLEDFTGQYCVNCPKAAELAHQLQGVFGNKLIVVSIHAGPFATKAFKTEAGDAYLEKFYSSSGLFPAGMIDRAGFNESNVTVSSIIANWTTYTFERTQKKTITMFDLDLSADYNESENSVIVTSQIKTEEETSGLKLQLWLLESHIINFQSSMENNNPITIGDYEHNHVLRDAVNGIWGEKIDLATGKTSRYISESYSLEGKAWVPENMSVVGFIYDENTMEILHATEISMTNNN